MANTNHDPGVILYYYLKAVEKMKGFTMSCKCEIYKSQHNLAGCPSIIRMDRGTENTKIAAAQLSFCTDYLDAYAGARSARFGTSPANIVSSN